MITNVQQEMNCLKMLMEGKNPELLVRLDFKMFGNPELGKLYLLVKRFYVENGNWPGWDVLRSMVQQKSSTADKARAVIALLDQIQERDISGLTDELLTKEMAETGRCRAILDSILELTKAAEDKDLEAVQALYRKGYEEAFLGGSEFSSNEADLLHMAGVDVSFNWRTTGIRGIDERNGITTGSLVLLCGDSGSGKSTAAHSIACHQYNKYGDGAGYWSWEQGKKELMARIFSHESDVDLGEIIDDVMSPGDRHLLRKSKLSFLFTVTAEDLAQYATNHDLTEEQFIQWAGDNFERRESGFYIFDHAPNFDDLMVQMELFRSTKGVKVFVIDYLTLIPPGASHKGMQSWEAFVRMSDTLKNFARRHDVIVLAPLQFDSKEQKVKFSKNIINASDLAIYMSQDKEDEEMGMVTWSFGKYRNFKTIPNKPLQSFKLMRAFEKAKFMDVSF